MKNQPVLSTVRKKRLQKLAIWGKPPFLKDVSKLAILGQSHLSPSEYPLSLPFHRGSKTLSSSPLLKSIFQQLAKPQTGLALPYSSVRRNFRLAQKWRSLSKQNIPREAPSGDASR